MKSKIITHIILEGIDGIGKDYICKHLWKMYNYEQRVYIRGEISDYVYAKKYDREFVSTQRSLPFLYVILLAEKKYVETNLLDRRKTLHEYQTEINKFNDQKLFIDAANKMKDDYHILVYKITDRNIDKICKDIYKLTTNYINSLKTDETINSFNIMYDNGCKEANLVLNVKNNQPFFNNTMIMADAQLHNGRYEPYDHSLPNRIWHNLIFSLAYTTEYSSKKEYDFAYPVNSKILIRKEIYDYINSITSSKLTVLTTNSSYIGNNKHIIKFDKVFGNDYIKQISKARATFYCSRDLSYLNFMTVRCYEAVLANQIIFVDKLTDIDCIILKEIYADNKDIINLLYVDETTLVKNYKKVIANENLVKYILEKQHCWYNKLKEKVYENCSKI